MRALLLFTLLLMSISNFAQVVPAPLKADDTKEIRYQARRRIEHDLKDLLNTLTFEDVGEAERKELIRNSYLPGVNQLFYDDGVVIEDDINPSRFDGSSVRDLIIPEYLSSLDLMYQKTSEPSIIISNIVVASEVQNADYPFIKVFFTSQFKSKHLKIPSPYRPTQRVAELRAEKKGKKWHLFVTRIAFAKADNEQLTIPAPTTTAQSKPINSEPKIANEVSNEQVALATLKKEINKPDRLLYKKRNRWLILTGVALAGSAATYFSLNSSYEKYKTRTETYQQDFNLWASLTNNQSLGKPIEQLSFLEFSQPGIFGVCGGAAVSIFSLTKTISLTQKIKRNNK